MTDKLETKKGIAEFFFWFISLTILRLIMILLAASFRPEIIPESAGQLLLHALKGGIGSAIVITMLNRLLPKLLNRIK